MAVNGSNRKPQLTLKISQLIQSAITKLQLPAITVSKNAKSDIKNVINIELVDKKQQPKIPMNLPNNTGERKPRNGKIKIQKYIINKFKN